MSKTSAAEVMDEAQEVSEVAHEVRILEAILFASAEPLSVQMLAQQLGDEADVAVMLEQLKETYASRGVNLVETEGQWSFRTAADLAGQMKITRQPRRKLPRAAAEVLAIIAYHQPVSRSEIESIRGVETSKGTLDILLELGWVRPGKRRDTPGRPLTWNTTTEFLSHFNLEGLSDLPGVDELKAAGLLDARPVLSNLPREQGDDTNEVAEEDGDFAAWVSNEPEAEAAE
jgi:segregation and condensation protein B